MSLKTYYYRGYDIAIFEKTGVYRFQICYKGRPCPVDETFSSYAEMIAMIAAEETVDELIKNPASVVDNGLIVWLCGNTKI